LPNKKQEFFSHFPLPFPKEKNFIIREQQWVILITIKELFAVNFETFIK